MRGRPPGGAAANVTMMRFYSGSLVHEITIYGFHLTLSKQASQSGRSSTRKQQAGIAIAVEAVAGLDRMKVGRLHHVQPHQSADEHEQGRLRKVEVGHQAVDCAK